MPARFFVSCLLAITAVGFAPAAPAQTKAELQERQAADEAVARATQHTGVVDLIDQATITLTPGMVFVPAAEANRQAVAFGADSDDKVLGYFKPAPNSGKHWLIEVYFNKYGYIKDDDTKGWDADQLLKNLQHNYEWLNERMRGSGEPDIEATGWLHAPEYDKAHHRLVYAIDAREKGVPRRADALERGQSQTLGREGSFNLVLLSDRDRLAAELPVLIELLDGLVYNDGKRYEDFDPSTDKLAKFHLPLLMGAHSSE